MNDIYNRKDEEFTVIGDVHESFKLKDPLYQEGFQAGAASRDAEVAEFQRQAEENRKWWRKYNESQRALKEENQLLTKQRDSFRDAAEYNKRRAEDAERQRDDLLKQVESIAFRIANKEYGHAALACEEVIANYPHWSLGEDVGAEGGA